jgi:hypothetical protein
MAVETRTSAAGHCPNSSGSFAIYAAPRLVPGQPLVHRAPVRVVVEVDVTESLTIVVADDEALGQLVDRPGRREAAVRHRPRFWR